VSVVPHTGWRALSSEVDIKEFTLADIGEGIAEVELLQWFVEKGDTIKAFDKICEVQSDKATVEITSRYDGKIAAMHHEVGSIVKVGSVLVDIEAKGGAGAGAAKGGAAKLATGTAGELQVPLKVPSPNTKVCSV
jgi:2-oxoisovalerate dehydrogenase E2 component (dihydrolipoyl transacylase)